MQETSKLVDELGRLHIYNYRDIYGKLVEKSKGLKEVPQKTSKAKKKKKAKTPKTKIKKKTKTISKRTQKTKKITRTKKKIKK